MNLNKLLKTFLFAGLFLLANILSAKEYRVTIKGEMLKSASLVTSEAGIKTSVSGIQSIIADKPEQIVLELLEFLPIDSPAFNQRVILDKVNILSPDAKIYVGSKDSNVEITNPIPVYRGKISDSESVNLCFTTKGIVGNFHIANKDYDIKPDETAFLNNDNQSHMVQVIKAPECGDNWCKTDVSNIPEDIIKLMVKSGEPQLKSVAAPLIAKVAVETDYETYEGFGKDTEKTAAWMLSLIANSSQIFEQEVNVKLEVKYLKVWTTPNDPYTALGFSLFPEFEDYVTKNLTSIDRDVAILLIKADNRLSGGLSRLDALGDPKTSILISGFAPLTHELGHIFGSPHTHNCYWPAGPNGTLAPIDKCATVEGDCGINEVISQEGTIMSYCWPQKNTFGPFVQNLIRARAHLKLGGIEPPKHTIIGKVICDGKGLSGVKMKALANNLEYFATTNENGEYSFQLADNLYNIYANLANYVFYPSNSQTEFIPVNLSETNATAVDFNAYKLEKDLFEPDDDLIGAKEITIDGKFNKHSIHSVVDVDYIKFNAEAGKTYHIVIQSILLNQQSFRICDNTGLELTSSVFKIAWKAEKTGSYFIKVLGPLGNYSLSINNVFSEFDLGISEPMFPTTNWGDYDFDGDLDLLLSSNDFISYSNTLSLYKNENGIFSKISPVFEPGSFEYRFPRWIDIDNDGDLDILIAERNNISVYYNLGGIFSSKNDLYLFTGPVYTMDLGDIDSDGNIDIIFSLDDKEYIQILKNKNGKYEKYETKIPKITFGKIKLVDYDSDGDLDIITCGSTAGNSSKDFSTGVFKNDGGVFTDSGIQLQRLAGFPDLAFGDFDNDGDLDIAFAGQIETGMITGIYENNGGVYKLNTNSLPGLRGVSIDWGDFDNDGNLDLVLSGNKISSCQSPYTAIFENKMNLFEETSFSKVLPQIETGETEWVDTNLDNSVDLSIIGDGMDIVSSKILLNENRNRNNPPFPPTALNSTVSETKVFLKWDESTDDKTPSKGLTYNLRIGTTPGGVDIVSPMSDSNSGRRLVSDRGNVGNILTKQYNLVKGGTYYWSVQSIDNSYAASTWAPEQTFTIASNNTPVANAGAEQTVNEGTVVILDGSLSSDADQDNLTYKWAAPSGIALSASTSQKPTLVAPEVKKDSTLVFTLVVNDGIVDSPPATVKVLVKNVLTVGINEVIDSGIEVYPNPTTGVVIISIDETISGYCDVAVYNSVGIIVNEIRAEVSNEIKIDLSDLISGSYLLTINTGNKVQSKILIKQ